MSFSRTSRLIGPAFEHATVADAMRTGQRVVPAREQVRATFCVVGQRLAALPDLFRREVGEDEAEPGVQRGAPQLVVGSRQRLSGPQGEAALWSGRW